MNPFSRCDGVSRRDSIRIGGLTALGLGVGDLIAARRTQGSELASRVPAKSCILIWLDGGPSHLETFDPKPDAPAEVRGPLGTVSTSIPGVALGECLPEVASMMDKFAVIRSMTSPLGEHNFGTHYLLTGYQPTPVLDYPMFGSVLTHLHGRSNALPSNIAVPTFRVGGAGMSGEGFLPSSARPFSVGGDPSKDDFSVEDLDLYHGIGLDRLDRRKTFVETLNRLGRTQESGHQGSGDSDRSRAYELITSESAKRAFKLSEEPSRVRNRYGRKSVGQSCLLARRLVERGVPFVTVNHRGWDTHENLTTRLKHGYAGAKVAVGLIPSLDLALSALVSDLSQRGLLDQTLVVVMGEFGRTPKLNVRGGRDHWPRVFSAVMAGGGSAGGTVYGSSDFSGESPKDDPVTPADFAATIYTLLGIDPARELRTDDGRPVRVASPEAKVVKDLIA